MASEGLLQGQDTGLVWQQVVVTTGGGIAALVQQLQIARVHSKGLVRVTADQIAVADIVGPGGATVGLASEGLVLARCLWSPFTIQAVGREGAEIASVGANGLHDHQILVLATDRVDLDRFEEVVGGVAQDGLGFSAEVAGEVANGHAGAVDLAIVAGEEKVHVGIVADEGLVDRASIRVGDGSREERARRGPPIRVGRIAGCFVGKGSGTPLVGQDPDIRW